MRCTEPGCMLRLAHAGAHVVTHRRWRQTVPRTPTNPTSKGVLVDAAHRTLEALNELPVVRGSELWHAREDLKAALHAAGYQLPRKQ